MIQGFCPAVATMGLAILLAPKDEVHSSYTVL